MLYHFPRFPHFPVPTLHRTLFSLLHFHLKLTSSCSETLKLAMGTNMEPEVNQCSLEVSKLALNPLRDAKNWVPLLQEPAYKSWRIRIVCVGAGYSGLMIAYECKYNKALEGFIDLTIYDKNEDVGGTWLENRYSGVAVRCSMIDSTALLTDVWELSAMFPRISTPSLLSLTQTGLHSMLQVLRSGPI